MKLIDIVRNMSSYHFMVKVAIPGKGIYDYMYDTPAVNGLGVDDMEVIDVYAKNEVEPESPISHSTTLRPIIVVMVRKDT